MTMWKTTLAAALLATLPGAAPATEPSQAETWGLFGEQPLRLEAKVTDLLCALTGDCPTDCGAGKRPLGLVADDGRLIVLAKNAEPIFTGAVVDMLPYCGKRVEVDGLMVGEGPARVYQAQLVRLAGSGKPFEKTERWSKAWDAAHPAAAKSEEPWFRKDPAIGALIRKNGYFGLGLEADEKYLKEQQ